MQGRADSAAGLRPISRATAPDLLQLSHTCKVEAWAKTPVSLAYLVPTSCSICQDYEDHACRLEAALADLLAAQQSPSGHTVAAGNTPTWAPPRSAARSQQPASRQVPASPAPVPAAKGAAGKPLGFGSSATTVGSSAGRKLKAAALQLADTEGLSVSRSSQSTSSMSRLGSAIPAKPKCVEQPRDSLDSRRDDVKAGKSRLSRLFKTGS